MDCVIGTTFTVYELLDSEGSTLYVGCSKNVQRRLAEHKNEKPWWTEVSQVNTRAFERLIDARKEEQRLMNSKQPPHNGARSTPYQHKANNYIGSSLKRVREDKLLTQQEVADAAGIGLSSIVRIENDKTEPRFSTIRKIAAALEVEPRELTGRG